MTQRQIPHAAPLPPCPAGHPARHIHDLRAAHAGGGHLQVGDVVVTNYGTGPFLVTEIHGPCACPEYLRHINGDDTPSEPHFHLVCSRDNGTGTAWLNGYRLDGSCVWSDDRLTVIGSRGSRRPRAVQMDLFEPRGTP